MKKLIYLFILIFAINPIFSKDDAKIKSTVKKMIGYIRYQKNEKAIELIDTKTFAKNMLMEYYDALSEQDKTDFEDALKNYIIKKSFPKALEYFDKIDINFEEPKEKKGTIELPSSVMYQGSQKIKFAWILIEKDGNYFISDFLTSNGKLASDKRQEIESKLKEKKVRELIDKVNDLANK